MNSAIFKIMPAAGGKFNAVNYNEKKVMKGSAGLVYFENFGNLQDKAIISKEEFKKYFQDYSGRNSKIKNPVFHATCSCKNKQLNHAQLKNIALEVIKGLGYSENPILIYEHHDTQNNHVHIVSSRIGVNGKKIKDNFERKRANQYLNAILNREPHQEFNRHLNTSLSYQFGTFAQFALLMELNGYKTQKKDERFLFFKHGEKQGYIAFSDIDKRIRMNESLEKNTNQIKALIHKYRKEYSGKLYSNHDGKFTTETKKFESDLTNFLKQKFGFEFIFFSAKDNERPYGYVLINHQKREVYKGSDLLKLDLLISNVVNKEKMAFSISNGHVYTKFQPDNTERFKEENDYEKPIQIGDILEDFLGEIERSNYQGDGRAKNKRYRKRRGI
jgi:hypothetical protein